MRTNAIEIGGKTRSCRERVEHCQRRCPGGNGLCLQADLARHPDKDTARFRLLFIEQADQLVVLLDRLQGLQINGLAARARAMNDARDAPLELLLHRDDEAFPADRNQLVPGFSPIG